MSVEWPDIYETNWGKLYESDVRAWDYQIRQAIPDIRPGEILSAIERLAIAPDANRDHPRKPRPRDVINAIHQARAKAKNYDHEQAAGGIDYESRLRDLQDLADAEDWMGITLYLGQKGTMGRFLISGEIQDRLEVDIKRRYPNYKRVWPEELCKTFEDMFKKPRPNRQVAA